MKCDEAMQRSAGRALGDLEPGELRELEAHLSGCDACREGAGHEERIVRSLGAENGVTPSPMRRERAVAAMVAARVPRIARRRWIAASVAAAVLASLAVPFLLASGGLGIERLDGTAMIEKAGGGIVPARVGDRLRAGDRLETQGVATLEGPGRLKVIALRNSGIRIDGTGRTTTIRLEKGTIRVDAPEAPVAIVDSRDRKILVSGAVEAGFVAVGGYPKDPGIKNGFQITVKKGTARYDGPSGLRTAAEGQTMTVTETGTVKVDDSPVDPGRKE